MIENLMIQKRSPLFLTNILVSRHLLVMLFELAKREINHDYSKYVTVNNLEDKINILRNKLKLRNKANPESIKSIFITADLTPLEQQQYKQLREQLKELNKDGNNYYIKNRAIVQRRKQ